jgi:hypothetical protein
MVIGFDGHPYEKLEKHSKAKNLMIEYREK